MSLQQHIPPVAAAGAAASAAGVVFATEVVRQVAGDVTLSGTAIAVFGMIIGPVVAGLIANYKGQISALKQINTNAAEAHSREAALLTEQCDKQIGVMTAEYGRTVARLDERIKALLADNHAKEAEKAEVYHQMTALLQEMASSGGLLAEKVRERLEDLLAAMAERDARAEARDGKADANQRQIMTLLSEILSRGEKAG